MSEHSYGGRVLAVIALITILLVAGLSYQYMMGTSEDQRNIVGVIIMDQAIISSDTASVATYAINQAITNDSIKAVVLQINSPGGSAHLIEQIYLDILELKQSKPVVVSVAMALSGGYYIAVAADYIFAHPSSMIGNVGVIGTGPPTVIPSESALETGPYKITGFSNLLFPFNLSHVLDSFTSAAEGAA
jgi:protease-4